MKEDEFDYAVMLLSGDWFLPIWERYGLLLHPRIKSAVQLGAQETVKEFIGNAAEYYHVNFSSSRLEKTKKDFFAKLNAKKIKGEEIEHLIDFIDELLFESQDQAGATLFFLKILNLELAKDSVSEVVAITGVSEKIVIAVRNAFDESETENLSEILERSLVSSTTAWDRYLRSLTPHQPTSLADWFSVHADNLRFKGCWLKLKKSLNQKEIDFLLQWCEREANRRAASDFNWKLPVWI